MDTLKAYFKSNFPKKEILQNYVRNLLESKHLEEQFVDDTLCLILKCHPDAERKGTYSIEYCYKDIDCSSPTKSITLFYKSNSQENVDSISWIKCIDNIYARKPIDNAKIIKYEKTKAFRLAAYDEKHIQFRNDNIIDNKAVCSNIECKKQCYRNPSNNKDKIHVDHYPVPFDAILKDFLKDNNYSLDDIDIQYVGATPHLIDDNLKRLFENYHRSKSSYRILCGSCNSHYGKYVCVL